MKAKSILSPRRQAFMVAVVLSAALTSSSQAATEHELPRDLADISRYCQACWRNARLPVDAWADCTQEVLARLLERVELNQWNAVLKGEGEERREFLRAIDAVKKRTQRTRKYAGLTTDVDSRPDAVNSDEWEAIEAVARKSLSPRQQRILQLSRDGWAVPEIADELNTTVERVSDEKYKAIRKLRRHFVEAA